MINVKDDMGTVMTKKVIRQILKTIYESTIHRILKKFNAITVL